MKKEKKTEVSGKVCGERKIIMWEIDLEIEDDAYRRLVEVGREMIQTDHKALFNYAAVKAFEAYVSLNKEKPKGKKTKK